MQNINTFIVTFLTKYSNTKNIDIWNSEDNQRNFENIFVKSTKPKRGKSAYIIFCGEERIKIAGENEKKDDCNKITSDVIMAELGKRWCELKENNNDELMRYNQLSKDDKERFNIKIKDCVPNREPKEVKKVKKVKKAVKDTSIHSPSPSKPMIKKITGKKITGWEYYTRMTRGKIKSRGLSFTDTTNELFRTWKELGDEGQQKWKNYTQ
jgi:hypothetical protein